MSFAIGIYTLISPSFKKLCLAPSPHCPYETAGYAMDQAAFVVTRLETLLKLCEIIPSEPLSLYLAFFGHQENPAEATLLSVANGSLDLVPPVYLQTAERAEMVHFIRPCLNHIYTGPF